MLRKPAGPTPLQAVTKVGEKGIAPMCTEAQANWSEVFSFSKGAPETLFTAYSLARDVTNSPRGETERQT